MSVADRALAAYESQQEAERLQKEAEKERRRGLALDAIARALEKLGMETESAMLGEELPLEHDYWAKTWSVLAPIDEDCALFITCDTSKENSVYMRVQPADELYYDIPPGESRGGTYGFYGLDRGYLGVNTLADLGKAITKVREARKQWCRKHNVDASQEPEMQKEVD